MKIAIYSRIIEGDNNSDIQHFFDELEKQNIEAVVFLPLMEQLRGIVRLPKTTTSFYLSEDLNNEIDYVVSLGGDGTLLDAVTLVRDKGIPILGINFGRLGFLASIGRDQMEGVVKAFSNRTFVVDKRTLIHLDANISMFGPVPFALNEFAIHKRDTASLIKIHTYLNGEFLNTYWADGLIVSTPTGSTGYSLSCNGPIVFPDSGSFVITPVAPHNLNVRSIVVPDNNVISFEVESRTEQIICAMDSRREIVSKDVQLAVKKENFSLNLLRPAENNFLQTLQHKLTWGLDRRN
ncbi:MAG: NAD kinase [Chitinophagaceae bacterium]|nr:MAG: NAD kinase [Chitinophagaceae bacterium]